MDGGSPLLLSGGTEPWGSIFPASSEEEGRGDVLHRHVLLDFETRRHVASPSDLGAFLVLAKLAHTLPRKWLFNVLGTLLAAGRALTPQTWKRR